jgi:hypothetical protein
MDQESIDVVLTALTAATVAGAGRGVQDAANDAVSSTYRALRNRLAHLCGKNTEADPFVDENLLSPEECRTDLARRLALIEGEPALDLVAMAGQLQVQLGGTGLRGSVSVRDSCGVQVNDGSYQPKQVNRFGGSTR